MTYPIDFNCNSEIIYLMMKHRRVIKIILLLIVLLGTLTIVAAFIYIRQPYGIIFVAPAQRLQSSGSIIPSVTPGILLPTSYASSVCTCSWAKSTDTNVELLVTSPSGQQEGYLLTSNSYINNIPEASYGIEQGIADPSKKELPLPDRLYFGVSDAENGIYELQVIGKQPGKYHLDVGFSWGPMNTKSVSVEGTLTTNQVDKYTVTLPDGVIQKVNQ